MGRSSTGLYLANPTSPIASQCASIVETSTLRVKYHYSISSMGQILDKQILNSRSCQTTNVETLHQLPLFIHFLIPIQRL